MAGVATAKPRTRKTFQKPEGIEAGKVYPVSALGLGATLGTGGGVGAAVHPWALLCAG